MKLTQLVYKCDGCGLCCTKMLARAMVTDAMREPRISAECRRAKVNDQVEDWYLLNKYEGGEELPPCRFHTGTGCGIYATRPGACVGFQAGSPDCQRLRIENGLTLLLPFEEDREEQYVEFEKAPEFVGSGAVDGTETRG